MIDHKEVNFLWICYLFLIMSYIVFTIFILQDKRDCQIQKSVNTRNILTGMLLCREEQAIQT